MNRPNLFIVGAPKCGTTTIYHYLKNYSRVFFTETKEPHFFSSDLGFRPGNYKKTLSSYQNLYDSPPNTALYLGDASVFYLYSAEAASNIYFFNPYSKIICLLRQPAEAIYSMFTFCLRLGAETIEDFDKALAAEQD